MEAEKAIEFAWISAPNPLAPSWLQTASTLLRIADVPLAAYALARGQRTLAVLAALRGSLGTGGLVWAERSVANKEKKASAVAVVAWHGMGALQMVLAKWLGTGKLARLFRILGAIQFVSWATCNPQYLLGMLVRYAWLLSTSGWMTVASKLRLEGTALCAERGFPSRSEQIGAEFVCRELQKRIPHLGDENARVRVHSVRVVPLSGGADESHVDRPQGFIGETVRVLVDYTKEDGSEIATGALPRSLVAKFPTRDFVLKIKMRSIGLYLREVRFYRELAPMLRAWDEKGDETQGLMLQVPVTYSECYDDRAADFCLLMQDAAPMTPGDETKGATWQQACSVALRYARFHSVFWSKDLQELESRHPQLAYHRCFDWMQVHSMAVETLCDRALATLMEEHRFARLVPPQVQKTLRLFLQHRELVLEEFKCGAMTFIHADCRMENMLWPAEEPLKDKQCRAGMGFDDRYERERTKWLSVDWQTSTKGIGVYDIAYFNGLDLDVASSAGDSCDRILVEQYYTELARCVAGSRSAALPTGSREHCEDEVSEESGAFLLAESDATVSARALSGYSLERCWRDYRLSMLVVSLIPIAVMQPESIGETGFDRAQRVRESMLERIVAAIERINAGQVLQELIDQRVPPREMRGVLTSYRAAEEGFVPHNESSGTYAALAAARMSKLAISPNGDLSKSESDSSSSAAVPAEARNEAIPAVLVPRAASAKDERMTHITPQLIETMKTRRIKTEALTKRKVVPGESERDAYDRWFLNGYDRSAKFFFAAAMGVYPARRIVDASFSVVVDGVQTNVRACRRLTEEEWPTVLASASSTQAFTTDSVVGPIKITVLEPLKKVLLDVHVPGTVTASLTFQARFAPIMEPPYEVTLPNIGRFQYDRLTQLVRWDGHISLHHAPRIDVVDWFGVRDRSWGARPHATADKSPSSNRLRGALLGNRIIRENLINPLLGSHRGPQFYWFWSPLNFPEGGICYHSQQDRTGHVDNGATHVFGDPFSCNVSPRSVSTCSDSAKKESSTSASSSFSPSDHLGATSPYGRVVSAGNSVRYRAGTRHLRSGAIVCILQDERRISLQLEPIGVCFFMSGVGYGHFDFGHACDTPLANGSDLAVRVDSFRSELVDRNNPLYFHVQELCRVTAQIFAAGASPDDAPIASAQGISAVEQLVVGPHAPSAFRQLYDTA